ncbi:hypothetical protein BST61_g9396 [Cercospora zeina]
MYTQLSRAERRNYYGNPNDRVYARRLREQRDAYFSDRMGTDNPRSNSAQRQEGQELWDGEGQYGYHGGRDRAPARGGMTRYGAGATEYGASGCGATGGYERYTDRSRDTHSPDQAGGSDYDHHATDTDYFGPASRDDRSLRPFNPSSNFTNWADAYAEPEGYQHGPYDYGRSARRETPAPARRSSNGDYPADRSRASHRIVTPMNGSQNDQPNAVTVRRWSEDRYYTDAYGRR